MRLTRIALIIAGIIASARLGGHAQDVSITTISPSGLLTFTEVSNALAYRIDWQTNVPSAAWQTSAPPGVAQIIAHGSGSRTATVGVSQAATYYRVVATLQEGTSTPPDMVSVPGGSFTMGNAFSSPPSDGSADELPQHTVTLTLFSMDRHEVSKALWDEVAAWAALRGYDLAASDGLGKTPGHPVQSVNWYEAVKWCNARSEREGFTPCYETTGGVYRTGIDPAVTCNWSANGYRLPTEAEWEYAARGGATGQRFPWSDASNINHSRANYFSYWIGSSPQFTYDIASTSGFHPSHADGTYPYTSPVGSFSANAFGLFDMSGNLWEWCWDWYDGSYYAASPATDPTGPAFGTLRVLRGGSWGSYANSARVADREPDLPTNEGYFDAGFRCVRRP